MNITTPEQSSKGLQSAQRSLVEAQEQHAKSLRNLQGLRRQFDATNTGLVDPSSEAGQRTREKLAELRSKIAGAIEQRDQAREALESAKIAAREAEQQACRAVGDQHRPEYITRLRKFVTAKLEAIEPHAVAAAAAVEIREAVSVALGVRREHYGRLPVALGLIEDYERYERMRQEVQELITAGVIQAKDIPQTLKKAWRI